MTATPEWYITALTLLLGGGGMAAILQTYRWWVDRKDKLTLEMQRRDIKHAFPKALREGVEIHGALNKLLRAVQADQAMILEARNGGDIPTPTSKLTSSVIYEVYSKDGTSVLEAWQNQPLDEAYRSLLLDVAELGMVRLVTDEMDQGALRNVYVRNDVYKSRVVRLRAERGKFFYMSVVWKEKPTLATEVIDDEIRQAKRIIQDYLESRSKVGVSL